MDDDFGADADLLAAMAATDPTPAARPQPAQPRKIVQPTPQRLDKAPPTSVSGNKVVQPTPQALPQKTGGSTILVSPRQRGNPVLTSLKSVPWEYSDIPADYVVGLTNCALFLRCVILRLNLVTSTNSASLKYHRLHPEYIYTRIRALQGKYNLRLLLTLVDIPNHEDPLRELSKTSLVNNVTLLLCWSAAEVARYLELFKSYENASFGAIKGTQSATYADKLQDFVTVPRSLNKSDAVALVANFGSLKNAVNADAESLGMISGWGGTKVKRWTKAMEEPFRVKKAAKRGLARGESTADGDNRIETLRNAVPLSRVPLREMTSLGTPGQSSRGSPVKGSTPRPADVTQGLHDLDDEDEEAMLAAAIEESKRTAQPGQADDGEQRQPSDLGATSQQESQSRGLSDGVAAALAKLRENGS